MESNWAAEHLQVIRTLMERSAVYRRALAPVMIFNGVVGAVGGILGSLLKIKTASGFIGFWAGVGVLALGGSFLLVRKQALKASEPFWSPPTRRVAQALLPPLTAGCILSVILVLSSGPEPRGVAGDAELALLPALWIILYGCALHAAGFFMPRGMKMFGWCFVVGRCALIAIRVPDGLRLV